MRWNATWAVVMILINLLATTSSQSPKMAWKDTIVAFSAHGEKINGFSVIKKYMWPQHYYDEIFVTTSEMNPQCLLSMICCFKKNP